MLALQSVASYPIGSGADVVKVEKVYADGHFGATTVNSTQVHPTPADGMEQSPQVSINFDNASAQTWQQDFDQEYTVRRIRMVGGPPYDTARTLVDLIGHGRVFELDWVSTVEAYEWSGLASATGILVVEPSGSRFGLHELEIWVEVDA